MLCLRHFAFAFVSALLVIGTATAQDGASATTQKPSSVTITATASIDRVRITTSTSIVQMHVELYAPSGEKVFDNEIRGGNIFDWHVQDGQAQRLVAGQYVCVVTVKNIAGRLTQKIGTVRVGEKDVGVESADVIRLTPQQSQAIGPVEENSSWTILDSNENQTTTVIAHDGTDGEIVRGRGAFSFRLGDFFSGNDKEQMRLTEEGNLGIGTAKPKFKLDVAGEIRAREGYVFNDGSTLNVNDKGILTRTSADGNVVPSVSGTGTQGRLAKWIDNSGTLGDSVALDTGTGLQMTVAPSGAIDTNLLYLNSTNGTTGVLAGSTPSFGAANGPFFAMRGNTYTTIANQRGLFTIAAGNVSSPVGDDGSVKFNTGNDLLRMVIRSTGNVGIGTSNPNSLLDVAGDINTTTHYKISGNRVFATPGTNNLFAGAGAGAVNQGTNNTFVGFNAGNANTTNVNFPANENSFFGSRAGELNTTGIRNSFFGSLAGNGNTTGNDNSIFGDRAGVLNNGSANAIFGTGAGFGNSSGSINSFFGRNAGNQNTTGSNNSFFGGLAGNNNTTGSNNSFVGESAGLSNTAENNNTFIGASANGMASITNATAIGANAQVTSSNSLILGSINGVNGAIADTSVGIGVTSPEQRLSVGGGVNIDQNGVNNGSIVNGLSFGHASGEGIASDRVASSNQFGLDFYTLFLNRMSITQNGNVGIGTTSPAHRLSIIGGPLWTASTWAGSVELANGSAIGWQSNNAGNRFGIGHTNGGLFLFATASDPGTTGNPSINQLVLDDSGNVGIGTTVPPVKLQVVGDIRVGTSGTNGCVQRFDATAIAGACVSDIRFKRDIRPFPNLLNRLARLQPVHYYWRASEYPERHFGDSQSYGLVAQEVERVLPELVGKDAQGYKTVDYSKLPLMMLQAIKELKAENDSLRRQNAALDARLKALEQRMK